MSTIKILYCCIAVLIPNIKAITIADALARNFVAHVSFQNKLLEELSTFFGFKLVTTTAYHPQSNRSLERSYAQLADFIRNHASDESTSVHSVTGFTPYEVIFVRKARNPTE